MRTLDSLSDLDASFIFEVSILALELHSLSVAQKIARVDRRKLLQAELLMATP
jgi:hypothetical protein